MFIGHFVNAETQARWPKFKYPWYVIHYLVFCSSCVKIITFMASPALIWSFLSMTMTCVYIYNMITVIVFHTVLEFTLHVLHAQQCKIRMMMSYECFMPPFFCRIGQMTLRWWEMEEGQRCGRLGFLQEDCPPGEMWFHTTVRSVYISHCNASNQSWYPGK